MISLGLSILFVSLIRTFYTTQIQHSYRIILSLPQFLYTVSFPKVNLIPVRIKQMVAENFTIKDISQGTNNG